MNQQEWKFKPREKFWFIRILPKFVEIRRVFWGTKHEVRWVRVVGVHSKCITSAHEVNKETSERGKKSVTPKRKMSLTVSLLNVNCLSLVTERKQTYLKPPTPSHLRVANLHPHPELSFTHTQDFVFNVLETVRLPFKIPVIKCPLVWGSKL